MGGGGSIKRKFLKSAEAKPVGRFQCGGFHIGPRLVLSVKPVDNSPEIEKMVGNLFSNIFSNTYFMPPYWTYSGRLTDEGPVK